MASGGGSNEEELSVDEEEFTKFPVHSVKNKYEQDKTYIDPYKNYVGKIVYDKDGKYMGIFEKVGSVLTQDSNFPTIIHLHEGNKMGIENAYILKDDNSSLASGSNSIKEAAFRFNGGKKRRTKRHRKNRRTTKRRKHRGKK